MKSYEVDYKIKSKDVCDYIILADFHGLFDTKIAETIRNNKAKYVIIAGDLLNGWEWNNSRKLKEVRRFIDIIKENHKVIIGLGNHDLWNLSNNGFKNYKSLENDKVYPLFNDSCIIDNNSFTNFLPDKTCFSYSKQDEQVTVDKIINTYDKKTNYTSDKYINHLVSHNPYHFSHFEVIDNISKKYDIIETGHFHDGWIPTKYLDQNYNMCIDKNFNEAFNYSLLKNEYDKCNINPKRNLQRGIVYMYKEGYYVILPNNEIYYYNKVNNTYTKSYDNTLKKRLSIEKVPALVITGAINTFLRLPIFYPYITKLETTKENEYKVKRKIN